MSQKSYTLEADEKATPVMLGTSHTLIWGDLVTKERVQMIAFLNTLAEEFITIHDAKILFLAPAQQAPPVERSRLYIKLQEILSFFAMNDQTPPPEESEVRRHEPVEVIVGSFQIKGTMLKSPITTVQNLLLVSKDAYFPIYNATLHHAAKPWLGTFTSNVIQFRRERLIMTVR